MIMGRNKRSVPILALSLLSIAVASAWAAPELPQVDGTTGAPLGGFGTGAVKFCGNNGRLFFADVAPVFCANSTSGFVGLPANFAFHANRGGTISASTRLISASANGRYDDDAIYPIQKANFGTINGINVSLVGSCPWALSDTNKLNYPCALFEFVLTNTLATPVDAAVGFKLTTGNTPTLAPGKGFRDEAANTHQKAIYAKSSGPADTITVGSDVNFLSSGKCSNSISGTTNMSSSSLHGTMRPILRTIIIRICSAQQVRLRTPAWPGSICS
jgi:hypothetical protein